MGFNKKNMDSPNNSNVQKILFIFSFFLAIVTLALGFFKNLSMFHGLWSLVELNHFLIFTTAYWSLAILLPNLKQGIFSPILLTTFLCFISGPSGFGSVAVVLLMVFSSYCLGRGVLPKLSCKYAIPIGLSLWAFFLGILVHYRVNYAVVYSLVFLIPVMIRLRSSVAEIRSFFCELPNGFNLKDFLSPVSGRPLSQEQFYYSILGYCILILAFFVPRPELGFDALGYHYFQISHLYHNYRASFDFHQNVMSVAPLGGDWIFSAAYILAGESAAHLINLVFVLVIAYLITSLLSAKNQTGWGLLMSAAFISTPLINLETSSLFVENIQTLFIFSATLLLLEFHKSGGKENFIGMVLLLSGSLFIKANSIMYLATIFPFVIWSFFKSKDTTAVAKVQLAFTSVVLFIVFGLTPYAFSFYRTGNPVFPFMNAIFKSPFFPSAQSFNNSLFNTPFNWRSIYDITFHSNRFLEGSDGSFGFHVLFFAPILLFMLPFIREYQKLLFFFVAIIYSILTFRFQSYLRYIYPALPGYLALCGMISTESTRTFSWERKSLEFLVIILIGINSYFRPSASFWFRDFNPSYTFDRKAQRTQIETSAPERLVIDYLNEKYLGSFKLLQLRMPYVYMAKGEVISRTWYHNGFAEEFEKASDLAQMISLFDRYKITHLCRDSNLVPMTQLSEHERLFRKFIERYSDFESGFSYLELRRLTQRNREVPAT